MSKEWNWILNQFNQYEAPRIMDKNLLIPDRINTIK